jgi:hypothetical protein
LTHNGAIDAFVAKVNPSGTGLVYAGYIGGAANDMGVAIAVDPAGAAYVAGNTSSTPATFPITDPPGTPYWGGDQDIFVAKVTPSGNAIALAGYVGGADVEFAYGIGLDAANNIYVSGYTRSTETTFEAVSAALAAHQGLEDIFVVKIPATADAFAYSTFWGSASADMGLAMAVDKAGNVWVTGRTTSPGFPVVGGPDLTYNGGGDAVVVKIGAFPGTAGPTLAFRNGFNAIETNTFPVNQLRNAGGSFRLDPVLAMAGRRAYLAGRDSNVGVWINFLKPDNTYNGWLFAGGNSPGQPALAAVEETAWIVIRDPWSSYYVRAFTPGTGFSPWGWLQGIFASAPSACACANGDLYVAGRDYWNGVWVRRYNSGTASWEPWKAIGGIIAGTPAITCGSDQHAYVAVRDTANNMWLAEVAPGGTSWFHGGGILDGDPQIAASGNLIHVVVLSAAAPWYRSWQIGSGWLGWASPGGVLVHSAPAVYGGYLYITGQDAGGNLWWWSSLSNTWTFFGNKNVAAGSRFSAGAR